MWKSADVPDLDKVYETAEMDILTERWREGNLEKIKMYWKPFVTGLIT